MKLALLWKSLPRSKPETRLFLTCFLNSNLNNQIIDLPVKVIVERLGFNRKIIVEAFDYLVENGYCQEEQLRKVRGMASKRYSWTKKFKPFFEHESYLNNGKHGVIKKVLSLANQNTDKLSPFKRPSIWLLCVLVYHGNELGIVDHISYKNLSNLTGMSVTRLKSQMKILRQHGYLIKIVPGVKSKSLFGTANSLIYLNLKKPIIKNKNITYYPIVCTGKAVGSVFSLFSDIKEINRVIKLSNGKERNSGQLKKSINLFHDKWKIADHIFSLHSLRAEDKEYQEVKEIVLGVLSFFDCNDLFRLIEYFQSVCDIYSSRILNYVIELELLTYFYEAKSHETDGGNNKPFEDAMNSKKGKIILKELADVILPEGAEEDLQMLNDNEFNFLKFIFRIIIDSLTPTLLNSIQNNSDTLIISLSERDWNNFRVICS